MRQEAMNVLVSGQFQQQAHSQDVDLYTSLQDVVRILENLRPENLTSHSMIHKLADTSEDIYVLRYRNLRFFLTIQGNDVLLIGIKKA